MKITAFARTEQGTGASRRLRNAGMTPGIVKSMARSNR
ncbi:MAG: Ribosomal L25p family [Burkholderiaceae bacterium]|nr:Ribosomal L25p family [Burkholderiaceae bacterium]